MTNKEIKLLYISLIDNKDATWDKYHIEMNETRWGLYRCKIGEIFIEEKPNYKLKFTNFNLSESAQISFEDIGLSKFIYNFPYFGVSDRIKRRIKLDKFNNSKNESSFKIKKVIEVLPKDLVRDFKIKKLDLK